MRAPLELRPQPGPQTQALASSADFVIFGGGAGGGKSWTILLEALRHIKNPSFNATFFRRSYPQIRSRTLAAYGMPAWRCSLSLVAFRK
ncbi:MAG: hypothetical protein DCF32_15280 [Leptolyngbya sp.]|nr:MAG: hypothetical protein DCF32_15280 [Leptolyngbya sp.]